MHMQSSAYDIESWGFWYFFYDGAGGPSMDRFCRNFEMEYRLDSPQLIRFTLHLGFVLTRIGLKGETGTFGRNFPADKGSWRPRAKEHSSIDATLMSEEAWSIQLKTFITRLIKTCDKTMFAIEIKTLATKLNVNFLFIVF